MNVMIKQMKNDENDGASHSGKLLLFSLGSSFYQYERSGFESAKLEEAGLMHEDSKIEETVRSILENAEKYVRNGVFINGISISDFPSLVN